MIVAFPGLFVLLLLFFSFFKKHYLSNVILLDLQVNESKSVKK